MGNEKVYKKIGEFSVYKGFKGSIEYCREDGTYCGRLLNTKDSITYNADSIGGLDMEYHKAVNNYLDNIRVHGK